MMVAIVERGSALHQAAGDLPARGSLVAQRKAELQAVLGSVGLGWLEEPLHAVGIKSIASLTTVTHEGTRRPRTIAELHAKLVSAGHRGVSSRATVRAQLTVLGLSS